MKRVSTFKWVMVAMVLCSTVSLSKAVPLLYIDNFSDGNLALQISAPGFVETTEVGLFEVMGGERFSRIDYLLGARSASLKLDKTDPGGQLLLNSDAGVQAKWTLIYGKNTDLNADFNVSDDKIVQVDWAGWTDDAADVTVKLMSGSGAQQAELTQATIGGAAAQEMEFTYADFLLNNPALDFGDIDRVTLLVEGRPSWDGQLQAASISVPEPASMTLLGVAGMALIRRRRRR